MGAVLNVQVPSRVARISAKQCPDSDSREQVRWARVLCAYRGRPAISVSSTVRQAPSPAFLQCRVEWREVQGQGRKLSSFFRDSWLQVPFSGVTRLSKAPKFARCNAKARASCVPHVLLWSYRRTLGATIFIDHKYWLWRGWSGAGVHGVASRALVSPQRWTTTSFDVAVYFYTQLYDPRSNMRHAVL